MISRISKIITNYKMKMKHPTLPFVFITFLVLLASPTYSYYPKQIPSIYVFGDSLVDSGNNKYIPKESFAKFPPYGIDFCGKPTGRYTNGKTVVDYLALHHGLPFAPPYLGLNKTQRKKIHTGINFACASSGILPDTYNDSLTLDKQIELFKSFLKNNLPNLFDDKEKLERHLSESLFIVSTGLNDHFATGDFRGSRKFASYLLKEFSLRLQIIYSLGARNFFVNNIAPAGCFPSYAAKSKPQGDCNETINNAISFYNDGLPLVLQNLQSQLSDFTFIHSDLYENFMYLRKNGHKYGISKIWEPCCPNTIYGDLKCEPYDVPCPNRNTHLFFDNHPSQISNHIYANRCFKDKIICKGFNML